MIKLLEKARSKQQKNEHQALKFLQ